MLPYFKKGSLGDVIKFFSRREHPPRWALNPMASVLTRREADAMEEASRRRRQRLEFCCREPRKAWSRQEPGKATQDSSLELLAGPWTCQHLDVKLPAATL